MIDHKSYTGFVNGRWTGYPRMEIRELTEVALAAGALCEEAGEVFGEFKKCLRDDASVLTPERRARIAFEMGDAIFYWTRIADQLGMTLEQIMALNVAKLQAPDPKKFMEDFINKGGLKL